MRLHLRTLALIFQASLDQGALPEVWKQAQKGQSHGSFAILDLSHLHSYFGFNNATKSKETRNKILRPDNIQV